MRKTITVQIDCCDFCGKEHSYYHCHACAKDLCDECCVGLPTEVYFDSSGNPKWCQECLENGAKDTKLYKACMVVQRLRHENTGWATDFRERMEEAQRAVKELM